MPTTDQLYTEWDEVCVFEIEATANWNTTLEFQLRISWLSTQSTYYQNLVHEVLKKNNCWVLLWLFLANTYLKKLSLMTKIVPSIATTTEENTNKISTLSWLKVWMESRIRFSCCDASHSDTMYVKSVKRSNAHKYVNALKAGNNMLVNAQHSTKKFRSQVDIKTLYT